MVTHKVLNRHLAQSSRLRWQTYLDQALSGQLSITQALENLNYTPLKRCMGMQGQAKARCRLQMYLASLPTVDQ
jgi:hypothetical protein